ncbi:MAG: hypothetical protein HC844_19140, partial [Tabrizicola sp.]|nr:hypothetical protein [Tabrizicola sp.]
ELELRQPRDLEHGVDIDPHRLKITPARREAGPPPARLLVLRIERIAEEAPVELLPGARALIPTGFALELPRGWNKLYKDGGLQYAPPVR